MAIGEQIKLVRMVLVSGYPCWERLREMVREELDEHLLGDYPNAMAVVTCRIHDYAREHLSLQKLEVKPLAPMQQWGVALRRCVSATARRWLTISQDTEFLGETRCLTGASCTSPDTGGPRTAGGSAYGAPQAELGLGDPRAVPARRPAFSRFRMPDAGFQPVALPPPTGR